MKQIWFLVVLVASISAADVAFGQESQEGVSPEAVGALSTGGIDELALIRGVYVDAIVGCDEQNRVNSVIPMAVRVSDGSGTLIELRSGLPGGVPSEGTFGVTQEMQVMMGPSSVGSAATVAVGQLVLAPGEGDCRDPSVPHSEVLATRYQVQLRDGLDWEFVRTWDESCGFLPTWGEIWWTRSGRQTLRVVREDGVSVAEPQWFLARRFKTRVECESLSSLEF